MKKSPLSMPSGSRGKPNYNRKSHEHKHRTGYGYSKSDSYQCVSSNGSQVHYGDDFLPLNISTPEQNNHSNNRYGSGGSRNNRSSGSGGFNHYRNNYHATPKSNFNNLYSPYKHSGKQFHGQRKGFQRDGRRQVDISRYVDMKSFLEDPWADLTKKLCQSRETAVENSAKVEHSFSPRSFCVNSKHDSESKTATDIDDSRYSQESAKTESSLDVTLGLDDTDASEVSKAESSIDLKFDNVTFSQESKNESTSSTNDSVCEDICKEDSIHRLCDAQTVLVQESI